MRYNNFKKAIFLERKNRFVAKVELEGQIESVHVPNTGRCKELLVPGATVFLNKSSNGTRKYPYTLYEVIKNGMYVHIDSAGANRLVEEALNKRSIKGLERIENLEREKNYSNSRFDFKFDYCGKACYMEVKGVTLEMDGKAYFPDAPTLRGARHVRELIEAKKQGFDSFIMFVIQMKGPDSFSPYYERDPQFAEALVVAKNAGVNILAYDCNVCPGNVFLDSRIPVCLDDMRLL